MRRFFCAVLGLSSAMAWAGRPFVTEDAGVLDASACEWENVAARTRTPGEASASLVSTQVGCGVGSKVQLAINASRERSAGAGSTGLGLGGKVGLWDSDAGAQLTLAWGSAWRRDPGGGMAWDGASAQVVLTHELGPWTLHANLGRSYARADRRSVSTWGLLAEHRVADSVDVGAEVFGEGSQRPGYGVGARWRPAEGWTLDASLARSGSRPRDRWATVGFKKEF